MKEKMFSWKMNKANWLSWIILTGFVYIMNGSKLALMIGFIPAIISNMLTSFLWIYTFKLIQFIINQFKNKVEIVND